MNEMESLKGSMNDRMIIVIVFKIEKNWNTIQSDV